jgi:hypothetical protein
MSDILMCRGWRPVLRGGEGEGGSGFVVGLGTGFAMRALQASGLGRRGITGGDIDNGNVRELQPSF